MDAPKCKICSKRHYNLCADVAKFASVDNPNETSLPVTEEEVVLPEPGTGEYISWLKAREWKRNYQREYMRKRRAEEKRRAEK